MRRQQNVVTFLFTSPNLPFTLTIIGSVVFLAAFLTLSGGDSGGGDAAAATTTTTTTATGGTATTTGGADGATTTTGAETDDGTATSTTAGATVTTAGGSTTTTEPSGPLQGLALEQLASGIPQPTFAMQPPGSPYVFVTERQGRVMAVDEDGVRSTPFLDLLDVVGSGGIENGLLGLTFHPEYATNGKLYVYFTDRELDSRVVEYTTSGLDATQVDRSTAREIFEIDQPEGSIRHRAGMLQFGPDGYLYIAFGDGGLGNQLAQQTDDPHGSILRVDVDSGDPYAIPAGNPFAGGGGDPRILMYGLRNPWRFDVDPATGLIYIADVGQGDKASDDEEVNIASITGDAGTNFGWPAFEGDDCFTPADGNCDSDGLTFAQLMYPHVDGACSITGGYVYRGNQIPELQGHYFYSDWCAGWVKSFKYENDAITEEQRWMGELERVGQVSSFGIDGNNEMLIVTSEGSIFRVVPVR
jgi:glucose/arabinose dehydrogenase